MSQGSSATAGSEIVTVVCASQPDTKSVTTTV